MKFKPIAAFYGVPIIALAGWVLHGFVEALLAACVIAVATWPLYRRFAARMPRRIGRSMSAVLFTLLMVVLVLAPLMFAVASLLIEVHATLLAIAAVDEKGIAPPPWLAHMPLVGPWLEAGWGKSLAHPGALSLWVERADPAALLMWGQSLGQFAVRHLFIVLFSILVLFFLYQEGESLAHELNCALRRCVGERAERYLNIASDSVRAAVNSMLLVGVFDGCVVWGAYCLVGVPHALTWGAITGALALVPFLGYVAVAALALQLAMAGAGTLAGVAFALGSVILFLGDKLVRPALARNGTRLPYVWILIGCLGGFEVLGLVGLVVGPVLLALTRELWQQWLRDPVLADDAGPRVPGEPRV